MTLYLTRHRAEIEAKKALLHYIGIKRAEIQPRKQRNYDGTIDIGFAVILRDHANKPVLAL